MPSVTSHAPSAAQCSPESGDTEWAVSTPRLVTPGTLRGDVGQIEVEVGCLDAAVDLEQLAGEVLPGPGAQVERRGRDVLGLADPAQWRLGLHLVHQLGLPGDVLQRAGHHRADVDPVDPDPRREV